MEHQDCKKKTCPKPCAIANDSAGQKKSNVLTEIEELKQRTCYNDTSRGTILMTWSCDCTGLHPGCVFSSNDFLKVDYAENSLSSQILNRTKV